MKLDAFLYDIVGLQPPVGGIATDNVRRSTAGINVGYVDGYWGGGEMVYARAGGVINAQELVQLAPALNTLTNPDGSGSFSSWELTAVQASTTVTPGIPLGVALQTMASGDYGWFIRSGRTPIRSTATPAALGPLWISATAGRIFFTDTAQKLVAPGRCADTAVRTVVVPTLKGISGQTTVRLANTRGLFVGMAATGTGAGASTVISAIDHGTGIVTMSVANSAAVTGNWTFFHSTTSGGSAPWFPVCEIDRPWAEHTV